MRLVILAFVRLFQNREWWAQMFRAFLSVMRIPMKMLEFCGNSAGTDPIKAFIRKGFGVVWKQAPDTDVLAGAPKADGGMTDRRELLGMRYMLCEDFPKRRKYFSFWGNLSRDST